MSYNQTTSSNQSAPFGCCLLGLVFALITGIFVLIKRVASAIWRALPMMIRGLYYFVAWPVLAFEYGWRRGGALRVLAVILGIVFAIFYGMTSSARSPAVTSQQMSLSATPSPTAHNVAVTTVLPLTHTATNAPLSTQAAAPADTQVPAPTNAPADTPAPAPTNAPADTPAPAPTNAPTDTPEPRATPIIAANTTTVAGMGAQAIDASWVEVQVSRVVDGDTIHVIYNGVDTTVRLIGIDTPETVDPRKPVQCYGAEASNYTKTQLNKQTVYLEFDQSQGTTDKYKRLLAFVRRADGSLFNYDVIFNGYAFEYTYQGNPYRYQAEFLQAARDARDNGRGLWAADTCNGIHSPAQAGSVPATQVTGGSDSTTSRESEAAAAAPCQIGQIKGNRKSNIYHVPSGASYAKTQADVACFDSEAAAVAAGYRKAKR